MSRIIDRRRFLTRTMAGGVATVFAPTILANCDAVSDLLDDAGVGDALSDIQIPDVTLPDVNALLASLQLDDGYIIADPSNNRLYRLNQEERTVALIDSSANEVWSFGGFGDTDDHLNFPASVAPGPDGSIYIVDAGAARVVHVDGDGAFMKAIGEGIEGAVSARGAVVDGDGVLWISDPHAHVVRGFDAAGTVVGTLGGLGEDGSNATELNAPRGLSLDGDGNLHVVDSGNARVQVFKRDGGHLRSYGTYGEGDGAHFIPRSVAISPNGFSYVADPVSGAIQVYTKAGDTLARLDALTLDSLSAVPLDVSLTGGGLVQVRLHSWTEAT